MSVFSSMLWTSKVQTTWDWLWWGALNASCKRCHSATGGEPVRSPDEPGSQGQGDSNGFLQSPTAADIATLLTRGTTARPQTSSKHPLPPALPSSSPLPIHLYKTHCVYLRSCSSEYYQCRQEQVRSTDDSMYFSGFPRQPLLFGYTGKETMG